MHTHARLLAALTSLTMTTGCPAEPDPGADAGADTGGGEDAGARDSGGADGGDTSPGVDAGEAGPDADAGPGAACDPCDYVPGEQYTELQEIDGFTVTSPAGGRELPILVRFPADAAGALPVVIWSHGGSWGPNKHLNHEAWSQAFARAGYAVVHWSMIQPTVGQLREICQLAGLQDPAGCDDLSVTGEVDPDTDPDDNPFQTTTITRAEDIKAVLAALPSIKERFARAGVELDVEAPALAGWSAGSQSVLGLAGATRLVADSLPPYSSPSDTPSAFIALSPQGPGHSKFFAGADGSSWDAVRGPALVLTGAGDTKPGNDLDGPTRRRAYELLPPGDKRLFYSTDEESGVRHSSFNLDDLGDADPRLDGLARALASSALAFTDCHTRGVQAGCDWLETDAALELAGGRAQIESK
jgi:hypothetical protein